MIWKFLKNTTKKEELETQKRGLKNQTQRTKEEIFRMKKQSRKKEAINNQQSITQLSISNSCPPIEYGYILNMFPRLNMVPTQSKNILLRVFMVNFGEQILMNE
jgi:hypothetical protein